MKYPIPLKMREEMSKDPFYGRCCVTGRLGKVEWHHNLIFAGKQVNEKFAILPLIEEIHDRVHEKVFKEIVDWIMLNRASDDELVKYGKVRNLKFERDRLNREMGPWYPGKYVEVEL